MVDSLAVTPAATAPAETHIVAHIANFDDEADTGSDVDSALGGFATDDDTSITTSLKSSIYQYREEHGRTYHKYKDGQYRFPNDEAEKERLDLQHHLYKLTLDQKLYLAPIKDVQNVLDIGTGTGIWASDFAEENPAAVVIGTDLSPIQPQFVPPNLSFLIDDANEDWVFTQKFDFIHSRQLHCCVEEKKLMRQSFKHLVPGGWLEMKELANPVQCDDGTASPSNSIQRWSEYMIDASTRVGQAYDNPPKYAAWMVDAGFINVHQVLYKWPSNPWPKSKKEKTLGLWSMVNALDGIHGFSMAVFTRVLGWKPEEVEAFLVGVRDEMKNQAIHNYYAVYITYGQKPEGPAPAPVSPEAPLSPA